jgi:hypothetical protein
MPSSRSWLWGLLHMLCTHARYTSSCTAPWALKPLAAHTEPSTSCQGPSGIRMGAAGMSNADAGAAMAALTAAPLLCMQGISWMTRPFSHMLSWCMGWAHPVPAGI